MQSITSSQGTAASGIGSSQEAQLTGQSITSSLGTVTIPNDVVFLSGVSASFNLGSIIGLGGASCSTNWSIYYSNLLDL